MWKKYLKLGAFLFVASSIFTTPAFSNAGSAIASFRDGCLTKAPDYSEAFKIFKNYGFTKPTNDEAVLGWDEVGFAGLGYTAKEGVENKNYSSGCFVYLKGTPLIKIATTVNFLVKENFKKISTKQVGKDLYWSLPKKNGKDLLVIVSEKSEGNYAGYTLMMITELPKGDSLK